MSSGDLTNEKIQEIIKGGHQIRFSESMMSPLDIEVIDAYEDRYLLAREVARWREFVKNQVTQMKFQLPDDGLEWGND